MLEEGSVRSCCLLDQMKSDGCFRFLQDFEYFSNLFEGSQTSESNTIIPLLIMRLWGSKVLIEVGVRIKARPQRPRL